MREITLFVLCQSTQILQRYCAPAALAFPSSPQREKATLFLSSREKGQLNNTEKKTLHI